MSNPEEKPYYVENATLERAIPIPEEEMEAYTSAAEELLQRVLQVEDQRERNLAYHNEETHIHDVVEAYSQIMDVIYKHRPDLVDTKRYLVGKLCAIGHDIVQEYELKEVKDGESREIERHRGIREHTVRYGNEGASAFVVAQVLSKPKYATLQATSEQVGEVIEATFPEFFSGNGQFVVYQPELTDGVASIEAVAMGMSDLMWHSGAVSETRCNARGWDEFREKFIGIEGDLARGKNKLNLQEKTKIGKEIIDWMTNQESFILNQEKLFNASFAIVDLAKISRGLLSYSAISFKELTLYLSTASLIYLGCR